MKRRSYPDGILLGGDPHQWLVEEKKGVEACHLPEVEVGVGAEAAVQKTRPDQKHLILKDLERNLQNQKARDQKHRKEKRKGKGCRLFEVIVLVADCELGL